MGVMYQLLMRLYLMNNSILTKTFEGNNIRVTTVGSEVYFVGKDVATVLGYSNTNDAVNYHVWDEYKHGVEIFDPIGRIQKAIGINEQGVYQLVFGSKKPEARRFQRWVMEDVLPSIRQTGSFSIQPMAPQLDPNVAALVVSAQATLASIAGLNNTVSHNKKEIEAIREETTSVVNKFQAAKGIGIYKYLKDTFSNITFGGTLKKELGAYMTRSGYEILGSYFEVEVGKTVNTYEPDAIENAITDLVNKGSIILYDPSRGQLQAKWHTKYKTMKRAPKTLYTQQEALDILYPSVPAIGVKAG